MAAIDCEGGLLELREGDAMVVAEVAGLPDELRGRRLTPEAAGIVSYVAEGSGVCLFSSNDTRLRSALLPGEDYEGRTLLAIPLIVSGDMVGLIVLVDPCPDTFSPGVLALARHAAVSIALALDNAQLLQERDDMRERHERDARRNQALAELHTFSSSRLEEEHVLRSLVAGSLEVLRARSAQLFARQPGGWVLRYSAGSPIKPQERAKQPDAEAVRQMVEAHLPVIMPFQPAGGDHATMLVPLMLGRDVLWLIELDYAEGDETARDDFEFARGLSLMASLTLQNARLYQDQRSLSLKLQHALLSPPHRFKGIAVGHAYASGTTGLEVGGDFYDLFSLPDHRLAVLLGDVSGKGVETAILASLVKNSLHAYLHEDHSLSAVMEQVNHLFLEESPSTAFVTLFCGVLDVDSGLFRYVQAGHPPAVVRRRQEGTVGFTQGLAPVLGVFSDALFPEQEMHLDVGDRLLLYTDGIMEARKNGVFFGEQGVADFVREHPKLPTRDCPIRLLEYVTDYVGGYLPDDVAVLCLQRKRKH